MAQDAFGKVPQSNIVSFANIGANQNEAHKVNDAIYQGIGFANTYMVTTPDGNVIIDTSAINRRPAHKELLTAVSDAPVRDIILTHGHGDHTGGVYLWKGDNTEIITQENFPKFCAYQDRLAPLLCPQQCRAIQLRRKAAGGAGALAAEQGGADDHVRRSVRL